MLRNEVMASRYVGNHRTRCDCLGNDPPLLLLAPPSATEHARDFRSAPNSLRVVTDVDHNVHTIRDPKRTARRAEGPGIDGDDGISWQMSPDERRENTLPHDLHLHAPASEQLVARSLHPLAHGGEVDIGQFSGPFARHAGDEHRVDVSGMGIGDNSCSAAAC
jgi:hypothetical protein